MLEIMLNLIHLIFKRYFLSKNPENPSDDPISSSNQNTHIPQTSEVQNQEQTDTLPNHIDEILISISVAHGYFGIINSYNNRIGNTSNLERVEPPQQEQRETIFAGLTSLTDSWATDRTAINTENPAESVNSQADLLSLIAENQEYDQE